MPTPVCQANPRVEESHVERVQEVANHQFTSSNPVQDRELLNRNARTLRERAISQALHLGIRTLAERVTDHLSPPTGLHHRTHVNILRLFSSNRVSTREMIALGRLMNDPDQVTAFRNRAQTLFLSARLFYFDYVPHQGAIMCYQSRD